MTQGSAAGGHQEGTRGVTQHVQARPDNSRTKQGGQVEEEDTGVRERGQRTTGQHPDTGFRGATKDCSKCSFSLRGNPKF